jgi:hypothetical protein
MPAGRQSQLDTLDTLLLLTRMPDETRPRVLDTYRAELTQLHELSTLDPSAVSRRITLMTQSIIHAMRTPAEQAAVVDRAIQRAHELLIAPATRGAANAVDHELERAAFELDVLHPIIASDQAALAIRDETARLLTDNLQRRAGQRHDTYWTHVNYSEVGQIAANVHLLALIARERVAPQLDEAARALATQRQQAVRGAAGNGAVIATW